MQGPLSINLSTSKTKTAVPTIQENLKVPFRVAGINKSHVEGKGDVLTFECDLVNPTITKDGTPLNPGDFGSKQFHKIQLYAKADAKDSEWFLTKLSKIIDACLGTGDPGNDKGKPVRPDFNDEVAAQMIGKTFIATMRIRAEEFGGGNEFGQLQFPADVKS